ncbi:hypothetical protein PLANPX_1444 [Lacipirellula parvula]|uniref:Uncharacterized protein n=1 Tax=Lacipirellula parvula TaxID=2650471 RepID=A0A5K7X7L6_9BACT|nr:hypothetical protein PLANPX_1444 [Lacipirellula parvula]
MLRGRRPLPQIFLARHLEGSEVISGRFELLEPLEPLDSSLRSR